MRLPRLRPLLLLLSSCALSHWLLAEVLSTALGFGVYAALAAPETGAPNRIDPAIRKVRHACKSRRGRRDSGARSVEVDENQNVSVLLRFAVGRYNFHLHHWLYLLLIAAAVCGVEAWVPCPVYQRIYGFCLGGSAQGLQYDDWTTVVWREPPSRRKHE